LNEALGWIGLRVDDIYGAAIGRLEDIWIDPSTGAPRWLLVKEGRFGGRSTLVPFGEAVAGDDHVWIPYEREVVREAPQIEPGVPLTQQVEATLRNHYAANATAAVSHGAQAGSGAWPRQAPEEDRRPHAATVRLAAAEPAPESEPVPPPRMPERPAPPVNAPPPPPEPPTYAYDEPRTQQPPPPPPQQQQQQPFAYQPPPPAPAAYPYQQPPAPQAPPAVDPLAALAGLPPGHIVEIELSGSVTISGELGRIRIVPPGHGSDRPR